jgi:hypothetical protein
MKTKILLSIMMLVLIITACSNEQQKIVITKDGKAYSTYETDLLTFQEFGNGIYYYDLKNWTDEDDIRDEFGPVLVNFIATHKTLKIVSISPIVDDKNTKGYWIITEPKITCSCNSIKTLPKKPKEENL